VPSGTYGQGTITLSTCNGGNRSILNSRLSFIGISIYLLVLWTLYIWNYRLYLHLWGISDWLINYSGGFVRRGLSGEVFLLLSDLTLITIPHLIIYTEFLSYGIFFCIFLSIIYSKKLPFWFILLTISPATVVFPILDPAGAGRKEILYFIIFSVWIFYLDRTIKTSLGAGLVFSATIVALILFHEGLVFFVPFFLAASVCMRWTQGREIGTNDLILPAAAVGTFLIIVIVGKKGASLPSEVCAPIIMRDLNEIFCQAASWLAKDTWQNVSANLYTFRKLDYFTIYPGLFLLSFLPMLLLYFQEPDQSYKQLFLTCVGLCMIATVPIYVLGIDWGRWVHITAISALLLSVALISPLQTKPSGPPRRLGAASISAALALVYFLCWALPSVLPFRQVRSIADHLFRYAMTIVSVGLAW
jgi:hypothetical protein